MEERAINELVGSVGSVCMPKRHYEVSFVHSGKLIVTQCDRCCAVVEESARLLSVDPSESGQSLGGLERST